MFEERVLANAPNTISGKISGVRFWHFLVGMPDFTLGGGRYTQVLKCMRRNSRVQRKKPVTLEMLTYVDSLRQPEDHQSIGISCAATVGFFFLLRVSELEKLRWIDVSLFIDQDGDACLRLTLPQSKTDQYNEGHVKVLKGTSHPLCPVRAMAQWAGIQCEGKTEGEQLVFPQNIRKALAYTLKLSAVFVGDDHHRISNHSLRSGGASLMFSVGFEMEIIKRWGRWISATFHQYLWRDEYIMSNISR